MHLLDVETLQLSIFSGSSIPPYAILSHTWDRDETSFQEICSDHATLEGKGGFEKIKAACKVAHSDGFKYIWIDTCCIDKASSAELSEAINSMFRWYQDADVCYVFLSDVHTTSDPKSQDSQFRSSRWFTRGWTLQELLAPRNLTFYTSSWEELGTKYDLHYLISQITTIPSTVLVNWKGAIAYSIAQKMSWAASRFTTREEGRAYCLMGIFNINMPMLYGEGRSAFRRLQEEIMKRNHDQSLFAWKLSRDQQRALFCNNIFKYIGLLAPDPCAFAESGQVMLLPNRNEEEYRTTNISGGSVVLNLPVVPSPNKEEGDDGLDYVLLNCYDACHATSMDSSRVGIQFKASPTSSISCRVNADILRPLELPHPIQRRTLHFITPHDRLFQLGDIYDQRMWIDNLERKGFRIERTLPQLSLQDGKFTAHKIRPKGFQVHAAFRYLGEGDKSFVLCVYSDAGTLVARLFPDAIWEDELSEEDFAKKFSFPGGSYEPMRERFKWYAEDGTWGVDLAMKRRLVDGERCSCVCLDIIDGPPQTNTQ